MLTAAELGAVASAVAVLVAIVFGTLTIRQWQRARELSAAAQLVQTLLTNEFTRSIGLVIELPEAAPAEAVSGRPELTHAVMVVAHGFESLGVLVFHRLLGLHLVDHLVGGYVRTSWRRLKPYVEARRALIGSYAEWYQWLAERMEEDPAPGKSTGAHLAHRHWRR
jgi:hypothetical protein